MPSGRAYIERTRLSDLIEGEIARAIRKANRQAQYDENSGEDPRRAHEALKKEIREAIACLRRLLKDVEAVENHQHQWNANDYCDICGADGRA